MDHYFRLFWGGLLLEQIKRPVRGIHNLNNKYRCWCYTRLKAKTGGSKIVTGWSGGRGYLRRGTRRKGERFESVRGECAILKIYT